MYIKRDKVWKWEVWKCKSC